MFYYNIFLIYFVKDLNKIKVNKLVLKHILKLINNCFKFIINY